MAQTINAVLFDLDGTLADTAADLAVAVNRLCAEEGQPPVDDAEFREVVSDGTPAMLKLAIGIGPEDENFAPLRERLLNLYSGNLAAHTKLFGGMQAVLDEIHRRGWPWGIMTNKPEHLTTPLLEQLRLQPAPASVVCGDQVSAAKPDPAGLLLACEQMGTEPQTTIYIGDASRDIEAAKRAGMPSIAAAWGYFPKTEKPADWGADELAQLPTDLIGCIDRLIG